MDKDFLTHRLTELQELYRHKQYPELINQCRTTMGIWGNDSRLRRLFLKARFAYILEQSSLGMFFLSIALFSLTLGGAIVYGKIEENFSLQNRQISSLIQEIGELKTENLALKRQSLLNRKDVDFLSGNVSSFTDSLSADLKNVIKQTKSASKNSDTVNHAQKPNLPSSQPSSDGSATILSQKNLLLIGTNAGLSDTLMLVTINPDNKKMTTVSIPRDTSVNGRKINEYFARFGPETLIEMVYQVTGLRADHYLAVDMAGFEKIIDLLGGIEVNVPRALVDRSFPGPKGSYTTFSLKTGQQHLDGKTALRYARSRKSTSDFDRARRQQELLAAVRDKIVTSGISDQTIDLVKTVYSYLKTDLDFASILSLLNNYKDFEVKTGNVPTTANLFYSTHNQAGQYILLPKVEGFEKVKEWVREILR